MNGILLLILSRRNVLNGLFETAVDFQSTDATTNKMWKKACCRRMKHCCSRRMQQPTEMYYRFLGTVATSGVFLFLFQTCAQASKHSSHKDKQPKETWLSPHARDIQLQVGSSGDPIRPLVAEILNINLLIGQGGKCAACLCGRCVCWLAHELEKRKQKNPEVATVLRKQ